MKFGESGTSFSRRSHRNELSQDEKGELLNRERLMKTNLINTVAIVVLATSISAFAVTGDTKREDPATTTCNTAQQNDSNQGASDPVESNVSMKLDQLQKEVQQLEAKDKERQEEEQKANQERMKRLRQQYEEWEHSLLGIYGG